MQAHLMPVAAEGIPSELGRDVSFQAIASSAAVTVSPDPTKIMTLCAIWGEMFQRLSTFRPRVRNFTVGELLIYRTNTSGAPSDACW